MDCSPPGSSIHRILQARILRSGLPFYSPGDLPDPRIEPRSPTLQAEALTSEPPGKPNVPLVSSFFLKRCLVFPILLFSLFFFFLHCSLEKAFLFLLASLWNSAFRWVYLSLSPLLLTSLLFLAICKAGQEE